MLRLKSKCVEDLNEEQAFNTFFCLINWFMYRPLQSRSVCWFSFNFTEGMY